VIAHLDCNATLAAVRRFKKVSRLVEPCNLSVTGYGIITAAANTVTAVIGAPHFYRFSKWIDR
jgi:hypothetical protein